MERRKGDPILWEKYGYTLEALMDGFQLSESMKQEIVFLPTNSQGQLLSHRGSKGNPGKQ